MIQVFCLSDPNFQCNIHEFSGVQGFYFSPDSNYIFITSEFNLRMSIYTLQGQFIGYIKNPKFSYKGFDISDDGELLAFIEHSDGRDLIQIIQIESWKVINVIEPKTSDVSDLKWSPNSKYLCVWDYIVDYNVLFYRYDGHLLLEYSPNENNLGVKRVQWSPKADMIALGGYDSKIRIINTLTWRVVCELDHTSLEKKDPTIFKEVQDRCKKIKLIFR